VKKEQKHYHFDWSVVPEEPARFENLLASHLLKWVHFEQDTQGRDLELRYFRDTDGREVDFVVIERRKPILLVQSKLGGRCHRPGTALPEGQVSRRGRLAGERHWAQGLRVSRKHPRRSGTQAAGWAGLIG
jgi:hypothetical protein